MEVADLECMLNIDPTVKCPFCGMTPLPEHLEEHIGVSHPDLYKQWVKRIRKENNAT